MRCRSIACFVISSVTAPLADQGRAGADPTRITPASFVAVGAPIPYARLIGGSPSGGPAASGAGGPLLGVEGAWATTLGATDDPAHGAGAFGARAGWAFANGLAVHVRYDDLGVEPAGLATPLQLATVGLRYSMPFLMPLPFAEVDAGPAFVGGDVRPGAGAGVGVSVPLGRQVLVDLAARDWLVPIAGVLRQTITAGLGLTVSFASPAR